MTEILIWGIGAMAALGGVVLGRLWGRVEGKRAGREEAYQDAQPNQTKRMERGRNALRDGRDSGTPSERLRDNDAAW